MGLQKVVVVANGRTVKLAGAPVETGGLCGPGQVLRVGEMGLTAVHIKDLLKTGFAVETIIDDDGAPFLPPADPAADKGGVTVPSDPPEAKTHGDRVGNPVASTAPRLAWDLDPEQLRKDIAAGLLGSDVATILGTLNRMTRERDQAQAPLSDIEQLVHLLSRDFVRK